MDVMANQYKVKTNTGRW